MSSIDLQALIPNNVNLADNRQLQRALEHWQPAFLNWWNEMGPSDFNSNQVYLRTAVGVDAAGWASYGYTPMPDYRWGIFLADREENRKIGFGDHMGAGRLAGRARRVPQHLSPSDRHAGRHRARVGGAAAPAGH